MEDRKSPGRRTKRQEPTIRTCSVAALALLLVLTTPLWTTASSQQSTEPTSSTAAGSLQDADRAPSPTPSGKDRTGAAWIDQAHEAPPSVHQAPNTGVLQVSVTLGGSSVPSPTRVENSTDPEVCGTEHNLQDLVVSSDNRGIRYVIAALVDVPESRIPDRTPERLVIDNRDCQFVPHAAVATVGDTIVALNSDSTLHNTHYYGPMRSNVALAVAGMSVSRIARRPGLATILCDVHGWMKAYLRIDRHPFHGVSDADGRVRIEGIPPGTYELELWHERLGERLEEVEIEAGSVTMLDAEFPSPNG